MKATMLRGILSVAAVAALSMQSLIAGDGSKEADMSKPVQVFILMGQSNMLGFGQVNAGKKGPEGSLENAVKNKQLYTYLVDDAGNFVERKDVRDVFIMNMGVKKNGWMVPKGKIGPEIGIGKYVGDALDAPVLILKSCIGNRSLGWDLLPPGSPRYSAEGIECPGYKETFVSKDDKTIVPYEEGKTLGWYGGKQYDTDVAGAKKVLSELDKYYPGAKEYKVAGFFFWQGDKDRYNKAHAATYEKNLMQLIKALRKDFDAPDAPFVCATLGQSKKGEANGNDALILEAQLAVDGESGKYPENKGKVATFYSNPVSKGGASNGHYNKNAETYMNVGEGMGKAMAKLLTE